MCQWTIASTPDHPILGRVVDRIWNIFDNSTDAEVRAMCRLSADASTRLDSPGLLTALLTDQSQECC